jgi:hypothetical protein
MEDLKRSLRIFSWYFPKFLSINYHIMNTKKALGFSVIAISLLLLAGCGGAKKAPVVTITGEVPAVIDTTVTKNKDATKEQCMDLMVFAFKVAQDQAQGKTDVATWVNKANDLELKYRAEGLEYEQACNKYLANTADMSFFNEVQKRVAELK